MVEGIVDIRLVPTWSASSVTRALMAALSRAAHLQAGIGYWTISGALLGDDLAARLGGDHGFVCVDLHLPTDVDALADLAGRGAQIRIHHESIRTHTAHGRQEPPQLLHSKMLLFWSSDRAAELWVGSHNWTNRALLGLNVEASLVVTMRDSSPLYMAAARYLARMKKISTPFDVSKVDFYKQVQQRTTPPLDPVIELEAEGAAALSGATVAIFGTETSELTPLDTMRHVHVVLTDRDARTRHVYTATILQSGLLAASDAGARGLSFSPRRHAFRRGRQRAALGPEQPIDPSVLDCAGYFVTLRLGALQPDLTIDDAAPAAPVIAAVPPEASAVLARMEAEAMARLFGGKTPRVRRALLDAEAPPRQTIAGCAEEALVVMRMVTRGVRVTDVGLGSGTDLSTTS
jgi:hypothetical protein